jgi:hypothetical protein
MPAKVMLPHSSCPINKWEAEGAPEIFQTPPEAGEAFDRLQKEIEETAPEQEKE